MIIDEEDGLYKVGNPIMRSDYYLGGIY